VINFRYHVVSLTAVFLALAIGLVVGTTALNGPVSDNLKAQVTSLNKDLGNKRDQINQYREEINSNQDFATEVAPAILNGKLSGRKLLVVALPGTADYVDGVVSMLKVAGATVTAQVTLQDKFFDPAMAYEMLDLASQSSQPSITMEGLPLNSDGVETATAQLAEALLLRSAGAQPTAADVTAVLSAYTKGGYVAASEKSVGGADGTVIVAGEPASDKDAAKKSQSAVTVATQLSAKRPLVVAGLAAGEGNLIAEVRGDPTLVKQISTVDNASTVEGQVATTLATAERLVQGRTGQYGLGGGAASMVPKAAA
jgi:Copper transport outer membrane protein, MctB